MAYSYRQSYPSQEQRTTAEELLAQPDVRTQLDGALDELDMLYDRVAEQTTFESTTIGQTLVTPSGLVVRADMLASPLQTPRQLNTTEAWLESRKSHEEGAFYFLCTFRLSSLLEPEFQPHPTALDHAAVTDLGAYVEIALPQDEPKPTDVSRDRSLSVEQRREAAQAYVDAVRRWRQRNHLILARSPHNPDLNRVGNEPGEPLPNILARLGFRS